MGGAAERAEVTIESLIREADEIQRLATAAGQTAAAKARTEIEGQVAGLWIEKTDNTNTNRNVDPNSLSDAEIIAIIEAGRGDSLRRSKRRLERTEGRQTIRAAREFLV